MIKRKMVVGCLLGAAVLGGSGYGIYRLILKDSTAVFVKPVSELNTGYYGENESGSGVITSKANQNIYLNSEDLVDQVYVKPGDKIKIGDKILSYDTTILELDLEASKLEKQAKELELKGAKADLIKLQSVTPIPDTGKESSVIDDVTDIQDKMDEFSENNSEEERVGWKKNEVGGPRFASGIVVMDGETVGEQIEAVIPETIESQPETILSETAAIQTESSIPESLEPQTEKVISETESSQPGSGGTETTEAPLETNATEIVTIQPETGFIGSSETVTETVLQTETQTETQSSEMQTESVLLPETPEVIEPEESPLGEIKAYRILNFLTKPYKGEGTKEKPYVFFCKEGALIQASFMNKLLGYNEKGNSRKQGGMSGNGQGCYAILEIREGDDISGGFIKSIQINGTVPTEKAFSPDITWTFTTNGIVKNVPVIIEETESTDQDDWLDSDFQNWDNEEVYTVSELKRAIEEKKQEIKELELSIREADLKISKNERKLDQSVVRGIIHGVVKSVGDLKEEQTGQPFIEITSDSGLYVKGSVNEFVLNRIQSGMNVSGYSYDSEVNFQAEITEISTYPSSENQGSSGSSGNVSLYPYLAYIQDAGELKDGEYVSLTLDETNEGEKEESLYLPKSYIRSDHGQSYVYKQDENHRLKKQYIKTGKVVDNSNVEIKSGLGMDDKIAFPYSRNIREGIGTKEETAKEEWQGEIDDQDGI